MQFIVIILTFS